MSNQTSMPYRVDHLLRLNVPPTWFSHTVTSTHTLSGSTNLSARSLGQGSPLVTNPCENGELTGKLNFTVQPIDTSR